MTKTFWVLILTCLSVVLIIPAPMQAGLIVSDWLLETAVIDVHSGEIDFSDMTVVQNPFVGSHTAIISSARSEAAYTFQWSGDSAAFLINASNQAQDLAGGTVESIAEGFIHFTPAVDTIVTSQTHYDYDLPGNLMQAVDITTVADRDFIQVYLDYGGVAFSFNGPVSDAFHDTRQGLVPAGTDAVIHYLMRVSTYGNTGLFATGSGYAQFDLQPVPEPAALLFLALGALLLPRRRSSRETASSRPCPLRPAQGLVQRSIHSCNAVN